VDSRPIRSRWREHSFEFVIERDRLGAQTYQATWGSLDRYRIPARFTDAKFGIFIHCGVCSVPAYAFGGSANEDEVPRGQSRSNICDQALPSQPHRVRIVL
jgi:Alpha-L-fucosidase